MKVSDPGVVNSCDWTTTPELELLDRLDELELAELVELLDDEDGLDELLDDSDDTLLVDDDDAELVLLELADDALLRLDALLVELLLGEDAELVELLDTLLLLLPLSELDEDGLLGEDVLLEDSSLWLLVELDEALLVELELAELLELRELSEDADEALLVELDELRLLVLEDADSWDSELVDEVLLCDDCELVELADDWLLLVRLLVLLDPDWLDSSVSTRPDTKMEYVTGPLVAVSRTLHADAVTGKASAAWECMIRTVRPVAPPLPVDSVGTQVSLLAGSVPLISSLPLPPV